MRSVGLAYGLLVICIVAPAHADWQYTRWGMSSAEVQASNRFIVPTTAKEQVDHNYPGFGSPSMKANYSASGMEFEARFYFSSDDKLRRVALSLKDKNNVEKLFLIMKSQYKSAREQSERSAQGGCRYLSRTWDDDIKKNEVVLNVSFCVDGQHTGSVIYTKQTDSQETGL